VRPAYSVRGQIADFEAARFGQETHLDDELRVVLEVELVTKDYFARDCGQQADVLLLQLGVVG
jgi:hypothetical protein